MALKVGIQDGNDGEGAASSKKGVIRQALQEGATMALEVGVQESGEGTGEEGVEGGGDGRRCSSGRHPGKRIEGGDDGAVRQTLQNGATTACEVGV